MRVLELKGSPKTMGEGFGESCRDEIQEFYHLRLSNALEQALQHGGRHVGEAHALEVSARCLPITQGYDPDGYEELLAIGRAANLSPEKIFAMNQLTDIRDVLSWGGELEIDGGCSSFVVQGDRTKSGRLICGQTWDLATNNMPFVLCVERKPKDAPSTICLTTVGCLCLIGLNEEGIAVGTTNIRTTDARKGVGYLSIIHKALSQKRFEDAVRAVIEAPRAGGHYYYVTDANDRAACIECSAVHAVKTDLDRGAYVQTNHVRASSLKALEADTPADSSRARCPRLEHLIESASEGVDEAMLQSFLADRENGDNAICRDDFNGISTNGAVVMTPSTPSVWMVHGQPSAGAWKNMLESRVEG